MVADQLVRRDIRDPRVLTAMSKVPRHLFVPTDQVAEAYSDGPLSIGHGQTISQPYIVASMTQSLKLGRESRVLEIGTGSGYQTAILAEVAAEVYSVEIVPDLLRVAERRLLELGYQNIRTRLGDGAMGWSEYAPFDGILVTAAAPVVPETLLTQLGSGGRMAIPVILSEARQELRLITRTGSGMVEEPMYDVRFVLMQGEVQYRGRRPMS
ncbi:MAG: protein-L-isoaspartate(D-aspartate) O-methyltransferase [candidate division Zixibacteria bacterium]|nr:protein-L-isoaspartate(D-aspartate) O-methyltransferase [candidate division Zixibacteria bacterium]